MNKSTSFRKKIYSGGEKGGMRKRADMLSFRNCHCVALFMPPD